MSGGCGSARLLTVGVPVWSTRSTLPLAAPRTGAPPGGPNTSSRHVFRLGADSVKMAHPHALQRQPSRHCSPLPSLRAGSGS